MRRVALDWMSRGWVVSLILLRGYAERESGYVWCVGVLVVVEAWQKGCCFEDWLARRQPDAQSTPRPYIPARWRNLNLPYVRWHVILPLSDWILAFLLEVDCRLHVHARFAMS